MSLKAQENRIQSDIKDVNDKFLRALKEAKEAQKFLDGLDIQDLTVHNIECARIFIVNAKEYVEEWKEALHGVRSVWGDERIESLLRLQPEQERRLGDRIKELEAKVDELSDLKKWLEGR